jgi:putative salt-induced outer membrane protein YdiY
MTVKSLLIAITLLFLLQTQVYAEDENNDKPSPWSGNFQLGYTGTGGNSQDTNLTSKFNLLYKKGNWTHTYRLSALYSDSNSAVTAERYANDFEWLYNFEPRFFGFLRNDSFYDAFNAYDISVSTAVGLGFRLINLKRFTWDIQGGPGYRYARVDATDEYERNLIAYASNVFNWQISKTASFQQTLSIDYGHDNTQMKSESALSLEIIGNLGMQVSYTITHNNTIPPGSGQTKKTDYRTDVTLLFSF